VLTNLNDCLTSKGFAVAEMHLAYGAAIDVYDLHLDAGGAAEDRAARDDQVDQLLIAIALRSAGRALVVAGDTNMRAGEAALARLIGEAGLTDSCRVLSCGDERIDRVLFRSSATVELFATRWRVASEFVDAQGFPLSDHRAVAVDFGGQRR
jgi:hypothetical protein